MMASFSTMCILALYMIGVDFSIGSHFVIVFYINWTIELVFNL